MTIEQSNIPVITIDGPSGSGKGTVAQALAVQLGWHYLDSGAVYRVLAFAALYNGIAENDDDALVDLSHHLPMKFQSKAGQWRVLLDEIDVTNDLRDEQVGSMASKISVHPPVRSALLELQRVFRTSPGLVTDGRDMGTIVFPDATLKIYLEASPRIRAQRRYSELKEKGIDVNIDKIYENLVERDRRDSERVASPTKPASDSVIIDTSSISANQVLAKVIDLVQKSSVF